MISLSKIRDKSKITRALRGKYLRDKMVKLLRLRIAFEADPINNKFSVPSNWKSSKAQLLEESHDKCAFCEREVPSGSYGDVEHYRPKSIYWWMAYTIDNYLLSCTVCNVNKSNTFDTDDSRVNHIPFPDLQNQAEVDQFLDTYALDPADILFDQSILGIETLAQSEKPLLLNPYRDPVETLFKYEYDEALQEVEIIPADPGHNRIKEINYTINLLQLNRPPLMRKRYREAIKLKQALDLGATMAQVRPLYAIPEAEYAGMSRHFLAEGF